MIDYGTRQTDLALKRLEARLRAVYRQAERDIAAKTEDYWKRHAARDAKYRQQVADGKLSKEDYEAWQRGQVFQGKQWESKRQSIEDTLYNADSTALQMINDGKMDVFTAGANYMGYELEQHGRIDTGFNLYDGPTVTRLLKDNPQILPKARVKKEKAYVWYNKLVNNCVLQGIIQGESINEIAARIGRTTGERTESAMKRNALTAYTGAQNAGRIEGMKQAQQMGIDVKKRWIATMDSRTRDAHRDLDGQVQDVDKPFKSSLGDIMYPGDPTAVPGNVYNCFVGETNVATDANIIRSYKHDYSGELITVKTASGVQFTCTPNHPILTPSGWVAAKCLNNGDDLLIASIGEVYALRVNPHVDHTPSRIDAIHHFFDITGSKRTVCLGVNFHGDVPTSDVEIITQKRFLRNNRDSGFADCVDKFLLKHTNESLAGKGAFMQHFRGVWLAALRFVGGFCEALSLFGRRVIHAVVHGFRPIARRDATVLQAQADSAAGDVQFLRKCLDGFTGKVFADNIVNIEITTVSHVPVYNLQTGNSRYFVNSIIAQNKGKCNGNFAIAHNCHCAVGSVYPKYPAAMTRRDAETGEVVGDMTYREWEAMKRIEGATPIDIPDQWAVVNGRDISETWQRRPDQFDFEINDVINAQGYDGKPRLVDADEFDRAVQESNFIAQRSYSAPDQETLDAYRDQLYHGEWYVDCSTGGAQYGQGMYCAADYTGTLTDGIKNEMEHYRGLGESRYNGGGVSYTETFTLSPDAKIVSWREINDIRMGNLDMEYRMREIERIVASHGFTQDEATFVKYNLGTGVSWGEVDAAARRLTPERRNELVDEFYRIGEEATRRYDEEHDRRVSLARIYQEKYHDIGSLAAALGYDAINAENHGQSGSYTVILNRTKVIFRRP